MHITGKAIINIDGQQLRTENGARLNAGGFNRNPERHGGETYYMEEDVAPTMECTVLHTAETNIIELSDITGATVIFEADTGQQYILRGAFTTEPVELDTSNGRATLRMAANSIDKV